MSCAACAAKVERSVKKIKGVSDVNVALLQNRMTLVAENAVTDAEIISAVRGAGYDAAPSGGEAKAAKADTSERERQKKQLILSFALFALLLLIAMGPAFSLRLIPSAGLSAAVQALLALGVMFLQRKYFISAFRALRHLGFNMDTLVSLGSLASFCYSLCNALTLPEEAGLEALSGSNPLFFDSAAGILCFVAIGKYFEARTKVSAADAVMRLYDLAPKFVCVEREGKEADVPLSEIKKGEVVVIRAGEQTGIDGTVISGEGYCDESALTGESRPVAKKAGSRIISASVLSSGHLKVRADAVGAETTLSKIIALVDEANAKKAPIARLADVAAGYFVPAVIAIACLVFLIWFFAFSAPFAAALNYAVCVLVISCPCALGLATPLAIMAGTGRAASAGILFKSPEALENLRKATVFVFDKTGTLTYGSMNVVAERFESGAEQERVKAAVAAAEAKSEHPLARALYKKYAQGALPEALDYQFTEGCGVTATVNGHRYGIGNERLAEKLGAKLSEEAQSYISVQEGAGRSVMLIIEDEKIAGQAVVADELKRSAKSAVAALKAMGAEVLMLTGDSGRIAAAIAAESGITQYRARLFPQDKAEIIKKLQGAGQNVVMVGDGVNDSVALATADTGIGLAGTSDIAVSSCQVVLLHGNLTDAANALTMSRKTITNIRENLFWAMIYNVIFIPIAAGLFSSWGLKLTPMAGAILMSLSSVCVGLNALRLALVKLQSSSDKKEMELMKKTITVNGMSCKHCVAAVTKALKAVPGVAGAEVSLERSNAVVECGAEVSDEALKKAVTDAGYEAGAVHA